MDFGPPFGRFGGRGRGRGPEGEGPGDGPFPGPWGPEGADEDVPVELDRQGERLERGQARLLAPLAARGRPQRGVPYLEVPAELEPGVGLAVVRQQDVAAGRVEALDELVAAPPERARAVRLKVAGAFHTDFMASAQDAVAEHAAGLVPADPDRTLLSNAETFAQLAIAARIGPERYGNTGLYDEPGTVMLTVSGAVARPMVIEVPTGVPLRYVLQLAGAPPVPQGVLTGGYHGKWIDAATVNEAVVSRNSLDAVGGALGAGAILPITQDTCPLGESLRVAQWLAEAYLDQAPDQPPDRGASDRGEP